MTPDAFRQRFPIFERKVFLNSCSKGALSQEVEKGYRDYLDSWRHEGSPWGDWVDKLEEVRSAFADFIGAAADEIAVSYSASTATASLLSALSFDGARNRILMKNIAYAGALTALLQIDMNIIKTLLEETFGDKKHLIDANMNAIELGFDFARENFECPLDLHVEAMQGTEGRIILDGNTAAALGCLYAGAAIGAWYPITPSTSLMDAFKAFCERYRVDPDTGEKNFVIIQSEDELAAIGMVVGAGWNGVRAFTPTSGPGRSPGCARPSPGVSFTARRYAPIASPSRTAPPCR